MTDDIYGKNYDALRPKNDTPEPPEAIPPNTVLEENPLHSTVSHPKNLNDTQISPEIVKKSENENKTHSGI